MPVSLAESVQRARHTTGEVLLRQEEGKEGSVGSGVACLGWSHHNHYWSSLLSARYAIPRAIYCVGNYVSLNSLL